VDKGAAAFGTAGSHGSSINGSIISGANSQKTGASHASTAAAADLQGIQQVITSAKKRREEVHTLRLCDAAAKGNLKLVQRFLSASRIDVNRGDSDGRRPLHLAACAGEVKVLELLISALADVNVRDKRDGSPLADALRHRHGAAAELLHAHGAVSDIAGRAELACFCAADATRADELSYLVRFQAEQAVENHDMRTPLHIAASSGHADHVVLLLANGADCNALDRSGCTPLRDAFKRGNAGCSEILLRHGGHMGANFDAAGHMCAAAAVDDTETLRRLLQHGCALNARNSDDRTPLHLAAANARLAATTLLLSQEGIETNAEDRFGTRPAARQPEAAGEAATRARAGGRTQRATLALTRRAPSRPRLVCARASAGYTPLDDAERASGKRYQVIQPLLTTHGATRGSAKLRLFGCSHSEEARAEIEVAVVSTQRTAAQQALNLRALVRAEVERAQRMRKYVDQALAIEHEEGEVLADAMPKIWQHLKSFATKHDARKEVFAGKLTPTIAQWSEAQGVGAELSVVSDLARKVRRAPARALRNGRQRRRVPTQSERALIALPRTPRCDPCAVASGATAQANALHALQLQASRDFERLVEVEFRGPTVADSTRLPVRDPSSPATPA
jgi:ankyrin repeat protein